MDYAEYNDDSESHPTTVAVLERTSKNTPIADDSSSF